MKPPITYVKGTTEEMQDLIDLADLVFSKSNGPHDFAQLLPKLYGENCQTQSYHYLAKEGDKIKAMICVAPQTMQILDEQFTCGTLGTVSVHSDQRGKGHMKVLMNMALQDMDEKGYELCTLQGQRQRYRYSGFDRTGYQYRLFLNDQNIRHECRTGTAPLLSFRSMKEDENALKLSWELHQKAPVKGIYTPETFLLRCLSWNSEPLAIYRDGRYLGYICVTSGKKATAYELRLLQSDGLQFIFRDLFQLLGIRELTITLEPWQLEETNTLLAICEEYEIPQYHNTRIKDLARLSGACLRLKAEKQRLCDGSLTIDTGEQRFCLSVTNGIPAMIQTDQDADVELSPMQAANLLFAPLGNGQIATELSPAVAQWLPLPFAFSPLDGC